MWTSPKVCIFLKILNSKKKKKLSMENYLEYRFIQQFPISMDTEGRIDSAECNKNVFH